MGRSNSSIQNESESDANNLNKYLWSVNTLIIYVEFENRPLLLRTPIEVSLGSRDSRPTPTPEAA